MLFSVGQFRGDEFISFVEVNGDDAAGPGITVGLKGGLLDVPLLVIKVMNLSFGKILEGENGGYLLLGAEIEKIDDGLSPGQACQPAEVRGPSSSESFRHR